MMMTVVVALLPCVFMAMYNTGYQAHLAIAGGALPLDTWQTDVMDALGYAFDPSDFTACLVHGVLYYFPVLLVTFPGGRQLRGVVRHGSQARNQRRLPGDRNALPVDPPADDSAVAGRDGRCPSASSSAKEIFGGTGMNILNPALTCRAFLFFAYPGQISGDAVWIAAQTGADGYSGATWLSEAAVAGPQALTAGVTWRDAFLGLVPGSMGETSAAACLFGAVVLIVSGVGSWRIMASIVAGSFLTAALLNGVGSETNLLFNVPFTWHVVLGGWAFGACVHGHRPGLGGAFEYGEIRLRAVDRRIGDLDSGRESGLPRGHDVGDSVHESVLGAD